MKNTVIQGSDQQTLIALVDANSFYANCEKVFDPTLRDKPVVVLSNNDGCVIAAGRDAKKLGAKMGKPWFEYRDEARALGIVAKSSNYELYGDLSSRMMTRLARYSAWQEVYSIDECFLGVKDGSQKLGLQIKDDIFKNVGVPVSVGVAPTKTLAKILNHWAKDHPESRGVCSILAFKERWNDPRFLELLDQVPVEEVWGVGRRVSQKLLAKGVETALDLREMDLGDAKKVFGINLQRTVLELRGTRCIELENPPKQKDQLIFSRMFSTPIKDVNDMHKVMAKYSAKVAARLQKQGSVASQITVFASSSYFAPEHYHTSFNRTAALQVPTDSPMKILEVAASLSELDFQDGAWYNRCGILLTGLQDKNLASSVFDIFKPEIDDSVSKVMSNIAEKFGEDTVGLGAGGFKTGLKWDMKRNLLSPRATTHWNELATVHAK